MLRVVVFDTSILISATISNKGNPHRCVRLAEVGKVESVSCREILEEFQEKLELKFEYSIERALLVVEQIKSFSRLVEISGELKVVKADPEDDKIVECAVVGGASHIISGDKRHLLPIKSYQGIDIVSAAAFVQILSGE